MPAGGSWVWTLGWVAWMAFFVIWEGLALAHPRWKGRTLSEHFWSWLKVDDPRPTVLTWGIRVSVIVACLWLGPHLAFGWFTPSDPVPW